MPRMMEHHQSHAAQFYYVAVVQYPVNLYRCIRTVFTAQSIIRTAAIGNYFSVNDTPEGEHILATRMDNATGVYDIWSLDVTRGTESRITSGPSTNIGPIVVPPGNTLIYSKYTGGSPQLYERDIAAGTETRLAPGEGFQEAVSITKDGGTLVYLQRRQRAVDPRRS